MKVRRKPSIRRAAAHDASEIQALQDGAFRIGGRREYEPAELEAFICHVGTLEASLIADGTYFVAVAEGEIVAAGGWSTRRAPYLEFIRSGEFAGTGGAIVRGIFTDPTFAGAGLAADILGFIEEDIARAGHDTAHLATTYTGMPFYTAAGFKPRSLVSLSFPGGRELHGVAMVKRIFGRLAAAA